MPEYKRFSREEVYSIQEEDLFKNAYALVSANYYEKLSLWQEFSIGGASLNRKVHRTVEEDMSYRREWVQLRYGFGVAVSKKTSVEYSGFTVDGLLVVFWTPSSTKVNFAKIRKFHDKMFDPEIVTDAMNFGNVMGRIRRMKSYDTPD